MKIKKGEKMFNWKKSMIRCGLSEIFTGFVLLGIAILEILGFDVIVIKGIEEKIFATALLALGGVIFILIGIQSIRTRNDVYVQKRL
ncbi:MAG: hypothetical protein V1928_02320 [Parcubacteria group bacterium]